MGPGPGTVRLPSHAPLTCSQPQLSLRPLDVPVPSFICLPSPETPFSGPTVKCILLFSGVWSQLGLNSNLS